MKVMFAGGGTGGHIFPALAIADAVKMLDPSAEILFIGAKGKIEEKIVPKAGYKLETITVAGFIRSLSAKNFVALYKLFLSLFQSFKLVKKFRPDVVIGTGGYVSGPVVFISALLGIPTLIQEQNSYPGFTTRILSLIADEVHVGFERTKSFLKRKEKVFVSGNPVRKNLKIYPKEEARKHFGLKLDKKTLFIFGGSSGARSINNAVLEIVDELVQDGLQIIWQTGSLDYEGVKKRCENLNGVKVMEFVEEIDIAYSACDIVVCRAGATTIAEITYLGIPAILVPYPYATANHQYENARLLFESGAGELVADAELKQNLKPKILELINDTAKLEQMRHKVKLLAKPDSAEIIAKSILKLAKGKNVQHG